MSLCDAPPGLKAIPAELFDEEGELEEHHIFCAVCYSYEMADVSACGVIPGGVLLLRAGGGGGGAFIS